MPGVRSGCNAGVCGRREWNEAERGFRKNGKRKEGAVAGEGEMGKYGTEGRKSFIECGCAALDVTKHNYLGNVGYTPDYLCFYPEFPTIFDGWIV